jgi:DNA methylase
MEISLSQKSLDGSNVIRLGKDRIVNLGDYLRDAQLNEWRDKSNVWEISGTIKELSYLTHGVFRFFGKFPPPVADRFICELHDPARGPVLDPMVGSGTTLVEAMKLGRSSIGVDVNPLNCLVSSVKTTYIPHNTIADAFEDLKKRYKMVSKSKLVYPVDPHLDHWFFPSTQRELAAIIQCINEIETRDSNELSNFFKVALASIIRQVSRASKGMGRMFLDPALKPPDTFEVLSTRVQQMSVLIGRLERLKPKPLVLLGDAKKISLPDNSAGLVICHPPYFNLYRYSSIYRFELLWLGMDVTRIRESEVREGFKMAKEDLVHNYVDDIDAVLNEVWRVLAPGCSCVLMIGDTVIKGAQIPATSMIVKSLTKEHFNVERILVRVPKYTEASYSAGQRRDSNTVGVKLPDHIVVLRRK